MGNKDIIHARYLALCLIGLFAVMSNADAQTSAANVAKMVKSYPSSIQPDLKLSAEFYVPAEPKPLCLFFHGWHMSAAGSAAAGYILPLTPHFFVVNVDMRGRAGNPGKPDANGFELMDALDALDFAQKTWPQTVNTNEAPRLIGGSGGGGNVLALAGKAPDIFAAGSEWAGMSDYALWYEGDKAKSYRDEMETKGWIGGAPSDNPAGYRSRGGLYLLENEITPLLVIHGRKDTSVPVIHAEIYKDRAKQLGKTQIKFLFNDKGHDSEQWPEMIAHLKSYAQAPALPMTGSLRIHGFVACRAFRLMLDDPEKMGTAIYRLDAKRRLSEMQFMPDNQAMPRACTLRLFNKPAGVTLTVADKTERLPVNLTEDYADYRWNGVAPWRVVINYVAHY